MVESLRIVIAEDNALIGMDLAELLGELGHQVCAMISTEADAVAAVARCNPDMIIVDSDSAGGGGIASVFRILERGPMLQMFVTGDPRDVLETVANVVVLLKPFNGKELKIGIAEACRRGSLKGKHLTQPAPCISFCPIPICFQRP